MDASFRSEWPGAAPLAQAVALPPGYRIEVLHSDEVDAALRFVDDAFPGLAVGNASCFLRPEFYASRVALAGAAGAAERDFRVVLVKRGDEWAALLAVERDADSQVLYGRLGTVARSHRGSGLGVLFPELMVAMACAMGLEMVYSLATLKSPAMQRAFERAGWRLAGIMPGFDREVLVPGVVKRVYEAIYVRLLVAADAIEQPRPEGMQPSTRDLFDRLFAAERQASSA